MVCTQCGFVGKPLKIVQGSIVMEIFLWLLFLFPGLLYSLWRIASKYDGCPKCKAKNMIPEDSPMGRKLVGSMGQVTKGAL
jgi:uncharacterized membrane protein YqaE (UPF0057 family)